MTSMLTSMLYILQDYAEAWEGSIQKFGLGGGGESYGDKCSEHVAAEEKLPPWKEHYIE